MNLNLTMLGQSIGFIVFVMFCMKYVWPPVITALRERQSRITAGIDAARRAERDLELAQEKVAEQLRDAKAQAAEIVEQANRRAAQIVEEAKAQAVSEADKVKAAAQTEIEQELNRSREALRAQVAQLVVTGAEKVLEDRVDAQAHSAFLDKLASGL